MRLLGIARMTPILITGFLSGCGSDGLGPPDPITELPRELTLAEEMVIGRSNTFGFDLLMEVDATRESSAPNTVLSRCSPDG